MSEMTKKTKVGILIGLTILFFPTFALSGFGMEFWHKRIKEKDTDPRSPENLLTLAHVYHHTYREETYRDMIIEWLDRYGGDETEKAPEDHYQPWDKSPYDEEHPRPPTWNKEPNKLTGQALCDLAEHLESNHRYPNSKHLFEMVVKYFSNDADALSRATKGLLREKTRTSF